MTQIRTGWLNPPLPREYCAAVEYNEPPAVILMRETRRRLAITSQRDASAVRRRLEENSARAACQSGSHPPHGGKFVPAQPTRTEETLSMAKTSAPVETHTYVVQAKHDGERSYADAAGASSTKPTEDRARAHLASLAVKHPATSRFRVVKRTTVSTHTDAPVK